MPNKLLILLKENFTVKGIFTGLLLSLLMVPFEEHFIVLVVICTLVLLLVLNKTNELLFIVISSFLIITQNISSDLRKIVQYGNLFLLFILFFNRYKNNLKQLPKIPRELTIFLLIYFCSFLVSIISSQNLYIGFIFFFQQCSFFIIIYFLFSLISTIKTVYFYFASIIFSALFHVVFALTNLFKGGSDFLSFNTDYLTTMSSDLLINKNSISIYIFYSVFLLYGIVYIVRKSDFFNQNKLIIQIGISFTYVIFFLGGIYLNSRAVILSVGITMIYSFYHLNRKALYTIIVVFFVFLIVVLVTPLIDIFTVYLRLETLATGRDLITNATFEVIKNNFLFGTGPGGVKTLLYKYLPYLLGSPEELYMRWHYNQIEYGHAHNYYLFLLSELGILGFIASIYLIVAYFKISQRVKNFYKDKSLEVNILATIIMGLGLGMFFRGLFEWAGILAFGMIITDLPFWIIFSILFFFDKHIIEKQNR